MNKNTLLYVYVYLILFSFSGKGQTVMNNRYVTAADLREWISFLASDEMKGRANNSEEMKTAATWIMDKFRTYGLQPVLSNGDYIQNYSAAARQRTINERNVIGIIPGSDPALKDQYIVLSAHFDHIGVRKGIKGDSICNGADDNAAGVCTLIGIADNIRMTGRRPGRTLIFAAFSGEEAGMRGSRYFVSNSPVPVKKIYVDINFEMIGHSEYLGKNNYYMTGCSLSNLDNIIIEYNKLTDFTLVDTISMASNLFYGSDNITFSMISREKDISTGIPSGTFATSTIAPYLHGPGDEASLFDFDNMARLVNHFSDIVLYLSDYKEEIKWTHPGFKRPE